MAEKAKKTVKRETKKQASPSEDQASAVLKMPEKLSFDYIKGTSFRVIHVDGVHGGPTPRGDGVQIAFFSERTPIPQHEEYDLTEKGALGKRTEMKKRDANVIREVEVEAILSLETAKKMEAWLHEKIKQIEELRGK